MKKTGVWFEVVWTYLGEDVLLGTYPSEAAAKKAFDSGPPRVTKLIHGGSLRVDECRRVEAS